MRPFLVGQFYESLTEIDCQTWKRKHLTRNCFPNLQRLLKSNLPNERYISSLDKYFWFSDNIVLSNGCPSYETQGQLVGAGWSKPGKNWSDETCKLSLFQFLPGLLCSASTNCHLSLWGWWLHEGKVNRNSFLLLWYAWSGVSYKGQALGKLTCRGDDFTCLVWPKSFSYKGVQFKKFFLLKMLMKHTPSWVLNQSKRQRKSPVCKLADRK